MHKTFDKHFSRAIKAFVKGRRSANRFNQTAIFRRQGSTANQGILVAGIVFLAQTQRVGNSITQCTDANLQGAAIRNKTTGIQTQQIVCGTDRRKFRHRKQGVIMLLASHQNIVGVERHFGIAAHIRQGFVYNCNRHKLPVGFPQQITQLGRGIRIAAHAQLHAAIVLPARHHLHNNVAAV